ncbi:MAG TPA: sugar ABC transporter substrate-binding protein [Armatimonadota bacterium]|jgi:ABC-type glycerol-3-phosphate transport system substrate-binding protein
MERESLTKVGVALLAASSLGFVWYFSRPLPPTGKTVIRHLTYETGPEQMALLNEIKRRFEAENPDVEVQVEFNSTAREKIYVEAASGTAPDTFYAVTDDIPRLALSNAIVNISDLARRDKIDLSVYFPEVVNALQWPQQSGPVLKDTGRLYAMPIHFSTDVLFYNVDAFKKANVPLPTDNWTWDQMIDAAHKLTIRKNGRIVQFGMFMPDSGAVIQGNGGQIFNADYTKCLINSPAALEAMQELKNIRFKENIAPTPAQVQETNSIQMFKLGQVAMLPGRTYMSVDFNKITDFTYDCTLVPGMKKAVERLAVGGICMSNIARGLDPAKMSPDDRLRIEKRRNAAWRWAKFYCSPDGGMQLLSKEKNCVTAVRAHAYSKDYFLKPPPKNAIAMVTSLKHAVITTPPIVTASEYLNSVQVPGFDDMLRTQDADLPAMLRDYQQKTDAILATEPKKGAQP